jgi:hypothetical protein
MKAFWTSLLTREEDKKEMEELVKGSRRVLERLAAELDKKIERSAKDSRKSTAYDSPNWPFKQADARGYERAMEEVKALINLKL